MKQKWNPKSVVSEKVQMKEEIYKQQIAELKDIIYAQFYQLNLSTKPDAPKFLTHENELKRTGTHDF